MVIYNSKQANIFCCPTMQRLKGMKVMANHHEMSACPKCGYIIDAPAGDPCPFCAVALVATGQDAEVWFATAHAARQRKYKDVWTEVVFTNPQFTLKSWEARLAAGSDRDRETASIVTPPQTGGVFEEKVEEKAGFFSRFGRSKTK